MKNRRIFAMICLLSFGGGWAVGEWRYGHAPGERVPQEHYRAPAIGMANNAIANFGLVPVQSQWLVAERATGEPVDAVLPDPEALVLRSEFEPHIEQLPPAYEYGPARWVITFSRGR